MEEIRGLADSLKIAPLAPLNPTDNESLARRAKRLLSIGRELGAQIEATQDGTAVACFELRLKLGLLTQLYKPDGPLTATLKQVVSTSTGRTELPDDMFAELNEQLSVGAPRTEIEKALFSLDHAADRFFAEESKAREDELQLP